MYFSPRKMQCFRHTFFFFSYPKSQETNKPKRGRARGKVRTVKRISIGKKSFWQHASNAKCQLMKPRSITRHFSPNEVAPLEKYELFVRLLLPPSLVLCLYCRHPCPLLSHDMSDFHGELGQVEWSGASQRQCR